MQVKKSQKIFEFFDFFKGIQRIFCAVGAKLGGRAKSCVKSVDKNAPWKFSCYESKC